VAASGPNDVWAVGYKSTGGLIRHRNGGYGGTWQEQIAPNPGTGIESLTDVTVGGPDEGRAVGYYPANGNRTLIVHHPNGGSWALENSQHIPGYANEFLEGVTMAGPGDVWAVGFYNGADGLDHTLT
jgi:hypothetical protein